MSEERVVCNLVKLASESLGVSSVKGIVYYVTRSKDRRITINDVTTPGGNRESEYFTGLYIDCSSDEDEGDVYTLYELTRGGIVKGMQKSLSIESLHPHIHHWFDHRHNTEPAALNLQDLTVKSEGSFLLSHDGNGIKADSVVGVRTDGRFIVVETNTGKEERLVYLPQSVDKALHRTPFSKQDSVRLQLVSHVLSRIEQVAKNV